MEIAPDCHADMSSDSYFLDLAQLVSHAGAVAVLDKFVVASAPQYRVLRRIGSGPKAQALE